MIAPAVADVPAAHDSALAEFQRALLELAFDAASAIPLDPHIKDRGKAQANVVAACLTLDQPTLAQSYLDKIADWRRGAGYAELAQYFTQKRLRVEAMRCLTIAEPYVEKTADWQRDRIRIKIAGAYLLLGDSKKAGSFEAGTDESESGALDAVEAATAPDDAFSSQIAAVHEAAGSGDFDKARHALEVCVELFSRYYDNTTRRAEVEKALESAWNLLPIVIRLDLIARVAKVAHSHGDRDKATELINRAQSLMDGVTWLPEDQVPRMARLAALRHAAGDTATAQRQIDDALALFLEQREQILNIDRAGVLRVIAEAHQSMGNTDDAHATFALALEAGVENPNSRPRAEDLAATCASLAVHAVEPDEVLWARLRQIRAALDHPW